MVIKGGLRVNLEGFVCLVPLDIVWVDLCVPCPLMDVRVELICMVKILLRHIASHRVTMGLVAARVDLKLNKGSSFIQHYHS
jgi:hypothetical protein